MSAIAPFINNGELSALDYSSFSESIQRANDNAEKSLKPSSKATYERYLAVFAKYCKEKNVPAPFNLSNQDASILCACFISDMKAKGCYTKSLITIRAALKYEYEHHGYDPSPTGTAQIKRMMQGISNVNIKTSKSKEGLTEEEIISMISLCDTSTKKGLMHRAIIAMCFCGAFRRSEVANLKISNLSAHKKGYKATIDDTKTGRVIKGVRSGDAIPIVKFLTEWLNVAGIKEGYIFHRFAKNDSISTTADFPHISDREVCRILKKYARMAGIDKDIGGHSGRKGAALRAAENGADVAKIAKLLGHRNYNSTKIYIEEADIFIDHALDGIV